MALLLFFFPFHFYFTFHFNSLIVLKPKQYARLSNEVKYKKSNHLYNVEYVVQSILKHENNFLSTNPTALILSIPVSEF